jgi:hypothetical protein
VISDADPEIQQAEIAAAAIVEIHGGVDLVVIGHHVHAITFLIGDQRIERDVVRCFFGTQGIIGRKGRTGFEGEAAGSADRGEIRLEVVVGVLFLAAATHAGGGQANHCNKQGTDEQFAHQFPPFYRSRYKHLRTNIV